MKKINFTYFKNYIIAKSKYYLSSLTGCAMEIKFIELFCIHSYGNTGQTKFYSCKQ